MMSHNMMLLGPLHSALYAVAEPDKGYVVRTHKSAGSSEPVLVPRTGSRWAVRMVPDISHLHRTIAGLSPDAREIGDFVEKYGPLARERTGGARLPKELNLPHPDGAERAEWRHSGWRLEPMIDKIARMALLVHVWDAVKDRREDALAPYLHREKYWTRANYHLSWKPTSKRWAIASDAMKGSSEVYVPVHHWGPPIRGKGTSRHAVMTMLQRDIQELLRGELSVSLAMRGSDHLAVASWMSIETAFGAGLVSLIREMAQVEKRARNCTVCGKLFTPNRSDAMYCSKACKTQAQRNRKKAAGKVPKRQTKARADG
jgi:ferredoxin